MNENATKWDIGMLLVLLTLFFALETCHLDRIENKLDQIRNEQIRLEINAQADRM